MDDQDYTIWETDRSCGLGRGDEPPVFLGGDRDMRGAVQVRKFRASSWREAKAYMAEEYGWDCPSEDDD